MKHLITYFLIFNSIIIFGQVDFIGQTCDSCDVENIAFTSSKSPSMGDTTSTLNLYDWQWTSNEMYYGEIQLNKLKITLRGLATYQITNTLSESTMTKILNSYLGDTEYKFNKRDYMNIVNMKRKPQFGLFKKLESFIKINYK